MFTAQDNVFRYDRPNIMWYSKSYCISLPLIAIGFKPWDIFK